MWAAKAPSSTLAPISEILFYLPLFFFLLHSACKEADFSVVCIQWLKKKETENKQQNIM